MLTCNILNVPSGLKRKNFLGVGSAVIVQYDKNIHKTNKYTTWRTILIFVTFLTLVRIKTVQNYRSRSHHVLAPRKL